MRRRHLQLSPVLACALALSGCLAGPHQLVPARQADLVESKAAQASQVRIDIDDRTAALGQKGYSLKYLRVLDWNKCVATLSNTNPAILPTPLTQTITATVNAATDARTASITFSPVTPTTGYSLQLDLQHTNPANATQTIATGTNANFTVAAGANPITVTLALNANGQLVVTVPQPTVGTTNVTSSVSTLSHFSATRVAGQNPGGSAAGTTPTTASFMEISGIETDAAGNMYVADSGNHTIRKIVPAAPSVVLGGISGSSGFSGDNGVATSAQLNTPRGLTRDAASNTLFFCDFGNNRIRRIDNAGNIFTYAGGGVDGLATVSNSLNATLNGPCGLVADQNGNIYFTERGSGRVRRIDPNGALTTLATFGAGTTGPLAIDRTNKLLWVGDGGTINIIKSIDTVPAGGGTVAGIGGGPVYTALAFDQVSTLYASSAAGGTTSANIWRLPVNNTGAFQPSRSGEIVGGIFGVSTAASADVSTVTVANCLTQPLAAGGLCGLYVDMWGGANAGAASGSLYFGNNFPTTYGEVVRLDPSTL
ncbi:MAG: repeat containing protein [Cyanobacteria bacterium RYN_339]|nr:repeat containing protein [Cyanobacteria bacterium RYN_339]